MKAKLENFGPNIDGTEVNVPEHVFPFEPRPYQQEVFDYLKAHPDIRNLGSWHRPIYIHKNSLPFSPMEGGGYVNIKKSDRIIFFDEYADWPTYKWWRNPIKKWKLNKLMRKIKWPN